MIKVEVIERFTLEDYKKLKNVKKVTNRKENEFDVKDTFECDEKMVDYLTGNNDFNKVVVKVIEVMPEKKIPVGELPPKIKNVDETLERIKESTKEIVDNGEITAYIDGKKVMEYIEKQETKPKKKRTSKK